MPMHVEEECVALEINRSDFMVDLATCKEQAMGINGIEFFVAIASEVFRERYRFW